MRDNLGISPPAVTSTLFSTFQVCLLSLYLPQGVVQTWSPYLSRGQTITSDLVHISFEYNCRFHVSKCSAITRRVVCVMQALQHNLERNPSSIPRFEVVCAFSQRNALVPNFQDSKSPKRHVDFIAYSCGTLRAIIEKYGQLVISTCFARAVCGERRRVVEIKYQIKIILDTERCQVVQEILMVP